MTSGSANHGACIPPSARAGTLGRPRGVTRRGGRGPGGAPSPPRPEGVGGQASVELVAMLPVVAVVGLAVLQLLAAGATRELAGHAAGAGAIAVLQRADAKAAARDSVPGWSRSRMTVDVRGGVVTVRMRPPTLVPGLPGLMVSTVRADVGAAR